MMRVDSAAPSKHRFTSLAALLMATASVGCSDVAAPAQEGETIAEQAQALVDYSSVSRVNGKDWYVDNQRWIMKGVNWDPSEPCEWYTQYNWGRADGDALIMQANGFNTIRTYGFSSAKAGLPENGYITMSQLDSFYNRGVRVVLTVHSAPGDATWSGAAYNGSNVLPATGDFSQAAKDRITLLQSHPAVIALGVGNEIHWNYFYTKDPGGAWSNGWTSNDVVNHANYVTSKIRALTTKPVTVSWGNTQEINLVPNLTADIVSYQIYNNLALDNILNLHPQSSGKPFYMSEFGSDAWNANINAEDEASQRVGNNNLFKQILDNSSTGANGTSAHKIVGGMVFSFSDGWWKAGGDACNHETGGVAPGVGPYPDLTFNEEWWGLCRGDGAVTRSCRSTIGDLKNLFAGYSGGGGGGAAPIANGTYELVGYHSGKCVDVSGAGVQDGANVQLWTCNHSNAQRFVVTNVSGNIYEFKNANSERCMDVAGASTADGANVQQWQCYGNGAQRYYVTDKGGGHFELKNINSNKCVDVGGWGTTDGTNIIQWGCSGGTNQQYSLLPVTATMYKDCNYTGTAVTLAPGNYTLSQLQAKGIASDDISSLVVPYGYRAVMYQNDNFSGFSTTLTGSTSCLVNTSAGRTAGNWNDDISSLRILPSDVLMPGYQLDPSAFIRSLDGRFTATQQTDGNFVLYMGASVLWANNQAGSGVSRMTMQPDGNLVAYDAANGARWATGTWNQAGNRVVLKNDGNLVMLNTGGNVAWQTNTGGH
jgi:hypothetical protein